MFANIAPRIWGLMLLMGGFGKIQDAVDALRFKSGRWWWLLIGAAVSIVLGVLALTHPGFIRESIAVFIGVSLLIEAVVDIVMMILVKKQNKAA